MVKTGSCGYQKFTDNVSAITGWPMDLFFLTIYNYISLSHNFKYLNYQNLLFTLTCTDNYYYNNAGDP